MIAWSDVEVDVRDFFRKMFSDCEAKDYITKFKEESREFIEEPSLEEAADAIINLIGWSMATGNDYEALARAIINKTKVLWERKWEKQPDGTYHHVKELK